MKKTTIILMLITAIYGYSQQAPFIKENFESSSLPNGWHTINYGTETLDWTFGSGDMPTGDDFSTNAAIFNDSNNAGGDKVILYHDPVDLSQHKSIVLSFDYAIQAFYVDSDYKGVLSVVVERKGSLGGWKTFLSFDSDTNPSPASYQMDTFFATYASDFDMSQIKIGFMWDDEGSDNAWGAGVDNVLFEAVPVNDSCDSAINITSFPYINLQDLTGTTNNDGFITETVSGLGMNDGVWYKFTAPYNGKMELSELTDSFDSEIAVYTGSCGSFTCVNNIDAKYSNDTEILNIDVEAETTYYINIGYFSDNEDYEETGNLDFSIKYYVTNDEASDAISVSVAGIGAGCVSPIIVHNNGGATDSASINGTPDFNNNGYSGGDVWYKFTAPSTGGVQLTIPNVSDWSSFMHALYTETDANVIDKLPDNQNYTVDISTNIPSVSHYMGLVPNQTYYLRVWEYDNDDFGDVEFCLEAILGNDEAADALSLNIHDVDTQFILLSYAYNVGATGSEAINGDPNYNYYNGGDVWFKFTAPDNGEVEVTVTESDWSSFVHVLYDAADSSTVLFTGINSNVNQSENVPDTYTYTGLTPGKEYYMRTYDFNNDNYGWVTFYLQKTATVGVETLEDLSFNFYPNPTTDYINLTGDKNIAEVSIVNLLGQEVKHIQPNSKNVSLNLRDLQKGIYLMKVNIENKVSTVKIIKK